VAVWDSKGSFDSFHSETLMPALSNVFGGFRDLPRNKALRSRISSRCDAVPGVGLDMC
jgi:hypothetical protein